MTKQPTEKAVIRLIKNLTKLTNNKDNRQDLIGRVFVWNNYIFATDSYIIHRIQHRDLFYLTFNQIKDHWYVVYIDENERIQFTDDDVTCERLNSNSKLAKQRFELFEELMEFDGVEKGMYIDPALLKKAIEPYNILKVKPLIKTVNKNCLYVNNWSDCLQIDTVCMGVRK